MRNRIAFFILVLPLLAFAVTPAQQSKLDQEEEALEMVARKYETPLDFGVDVGYSLRRFENYKYTDTVASTDAGYGGLSVMIEWLPVTQYGKLGVGAGFGFSVHPNVLILDTDPDDEVATLYTVPLEIGLSYHADYLRHQILVPYGRFGASMTLLKQNSDYGYSRPLTTYMALELAGGLQLCLNPLEPGAAREMDQTLGINVSYLFGEYHVTQSMGSGSSVDLSRKEWRFGIRFEF